MPAQTRNNRAAGEGAGGRQKFADKTDSRVEPTLRDLRRKLVGNRREILKRLVVTVFVVGSTWALVSRINLRQLASQYPAATDSARVAMGALAANARSAAGAIDAEAGLALAKIHLPAAKSASPAVAAHDVATHETFHGRRLAAMHARRASAIALARRHAVLHSHKYAVAHAQAAVADTASAGIGTEGLGNWLENDFPTQFSNELGKAYYMLLNFGSNAIELNWAPGLRNWLSGELQFVSSNFNNGGSGLGVSRDLGSLAGSILTARVLFSAGVGFMMFGLLIGLSGTRRRPKVDRRNYAD